jgi:hypothetical protein
MVEHRQIGRAAATCASASDPAHFRRALYVRTLLRYEREPYDRRAGGRSRSNVLERRGVDESRSGHRPLRLQIRTRIPRQCHRPSQIRLDGGCSFARRPGLWESAPSDGTHHWSRCGGRFNAGRSRQWGRALRAPRGLWRPLRCGLDQWVDSNSAIRWALGQIPGRFPVDWLGHVGRGPVIFSRSRAGRRDRGRARLDPGGNSTDLFRPHNTRRSCSVRARRTLLGGGS